MTPGIPAPGASGVGTSVHWRAVQTSPHARRDGHFRLLGFPTTLRPGFPLFLVVITFLYPWPLGAWIGGSIAVLTVVHELGHALVARWFGCEARISLDFMVAYASFAPAPGFNRLRRAVVALAGPAAQVSLSVAVLLLMGVDPLSRASIASTDASIAVWWTGIVLGLVNLLPLTPLDGGAVVASALDALFPGRGQRLMLRSSIVITATVVSAMVATGHSEFLLFFVFILFFQWQSLRAERALAAFAGEPHPHPTGNGFLDSTVASVHLEDGRPVNALAFCREAWESGPTAGIAVVAARACAAMGENDAALQWVDAALAASLDDLETLGMLNSARELDGLRGDPGFGAAVESLSGEL